MDKPRLALILGSGFSKEAGLPTTNELAARFLSPRTSDDNNGVLETAVTKILKKFWSDVFKYGAGEAQPTLEDHFTLLDLAANSGHHLGPDYSPKKLRAIRRMSIHRVFDILDEQITNKQTLQRFLRKLRDSFRCSVVTLNWDIVVEDLLEWRDFCYGVKILGLGNQGSLMSTEDFPVLKLHGSTNWVYCDACRRLYMGTGGKTTLRRKAFLEVDDFQLFSELVLNMEQIKLALASGPDRYTRACPFCGNAMGARVATFSYRKAFSINQFQTIWEHAHAVLSEANTWLVIGYSLPAADFEFRHLLKSAQLARRNGRTWKCQVVVEGKCSVPRYRSFFGLRDRQICTGGLSKWIDERLEAFCANAEPSPDSAPLGPSGES